MGNIFQPSQVVSFTIGKKPRESPATYNSNAPKLACICCPVTTPSGTTTCILPPALRKAIKPKPSKKNPLPVPTFFAENSPFLR